MKPFLAALALLVALAAPAAAESSLAVSDVAWRPGGLTLTAHAPPFAVVEVCAASPRDVQCQAPQGGGEALAFSIEARPGDTIAVWAGGRPYTPGEIPSVLALAFLPAPAAPVTLHLPGVAR